VAFNNLLAIGVLRRLQHLGVDVPGEVSVIGYDDIFGSDFCQPPLTTITAPIEQADRTLIDLLLGVHDAERVPHVVLSAVLRARDLTGPAKRFG
jgi:DNA-binding LacI/PurR family transcriptional regulator